VLEDPFGRMPPRVRQLNNAHGDARCAFRFAEGNGMCSFGEDDKDGLGKGLKI
jgi:hypothetical protein